MPRKNAPSPADRLLGSRIKALRLKRGMSQLQLGTKVNSLLQEIDKYEQGAWLPITKLEAIAEALDAPIPKKRIRRIVNARKLEQETGEVSEELPILYGEVLEDDE